MEFDFSPFFEKYQSLVAIADSVFERIKQEYPDCVKCQIECSDCCHALFDLSLIEALYINHQFNRMFSGTEKERLTEKANKADRSIYKLKRKAYKEFQEGKSEAEILDDMSKERIRCPLLNEKDLCDLYDYRPITCRLYGIPTSIGGQSHTCGISGFKEGKPYPTVKIDVIHTQLYEIADAFVKSIHTRYKTMADMLVPLSMALLTTYDEEYLGTKNEENKDKEPKG